MLVNTLITNRQYAHAGFHMLVVLCAGSGSGHYNPRDEVVVRMEYLSEADLKCTLSAMHCMEVIGLIVLLLVLLAKLRQGNGSFIANNTLNVVNTAVGALLWLALLEFFSIYCHGIRSVNRCATTSPSWSVRITRNMPSLQMS